ncbi:MAG: hypothetical protein R2881_07250 [Eubacteriales bacterium]
MKVEIDALVTKTIPITTSFSVGFYWADMDAMTTTSRIDITGPKTDISNITYGECVGRSKRQNGYDIQHV